MDFFPTSRLGSETPLHGGKDLDARLGAFCPPVRCPVCCDLSAEMTGENLSMCTTCGHIFQTDLQVTVSYDAAYARQYDSRPVVQMSQVRWQFIQSCLQLGERSRILDVGYGNGAFLKHAKFNGMEIFGTDLHHQDFGIPEVGLETALHFDLVCFFDSLEHFTGFDQLLTLQAKYAAVSVPNLPVSFLKDPQGWRHYKPGEHLHYFSHGSLDALMRRWGFIRRIQSGYPEDVIRGKLPIGTDNVDNIYTAIYGKN